MSSPAAIQYLHAYVNWKMNDEYEYEHDIRTCPISKVRCLKYHALCHDHDKKDKRDKKGRPDRIRKS